MRLMFVFISLLVASTVAAQEVTIPEKPVDPKGCVMKKASDGSKRGFLWKPVAAHFPGPVVLLPEKYAGFKIAKMEIINLAGKVVAKPRMKSSGVCAPGTECLFRPAFQEYRVTAAKLRRLYKSVIVRSTPKEGVCFSYLIPNPNKRYD